MFGREGQIGILFWHPDEEYVWQHYPLYDEEDYEGAVFETKNKPLEGNDEDSNI